MVKFKVGDIVRCKKKFSSIYRGAGMDALCKVITVPSLIEKRRILDEYPLNVEVLIIGHKRAEFIGGRYRVYDFHFRRATERDRKQFLLYAL
jgi:hypothetical protein